MEDWSNSLVLDFLDLYEKHSAIWDPSNPDHKNRTVVAESWLSIRNSMSVDFTVEALKRKKESLMATYRILKRKVTASMSNAGNDDIYKPTWFAFQAMDNFLGRVRASKKTINTEDIEENTADEFEDKTVKEPMYNVEGNSCTGSLIVVPQEASLESQCLPTNQRNLKRKNVSYIDEIETEESLKQDCDLMKVLVQRPIQERNEPDECALFGQLLASKLRALNKRNRKVLMNKIDNIVFETEMVEIDSQTTDSPRTQFLTISDNSLSDSPLPSPHISPQF